MSVITNPRGKWEHNLINTTNAMQCEKQGSISVMPIHKIDFSICQPIGSFLEHSCTYAVYSLNFPQFDDHLSSTNYNQTKALLLSYFITLSST